MRHSFKGAAAVAALCAGALTMTSVAVAALPDVVSGDASGSGSNAKDVRVAGVDRIQTSLEALAKHTGTVNVMIVGYQGVVDALSLPPLAQAAGDSAIVYSDRNGLDARVLNALKALQSAGNLGNVYISGGYGAVPANVWYQLTGKVGAAPSSIVRIAGMDRYETSYLTAALALGGSTVMTDLQAVNGIERLKAEFPSIKADYMKAAAELQAATAAKTKADAEEAAASHNFATEVAKVSLVDKAGALADFESAVKANEAAQKTYSDLVSLKPAMARVLEAAKAWKPETWKTTTLADIKTGASDVAKDVDDIVKGVSSVTDSTLAGEAEGKLSQEIEAADTARQQKNDELATASEKFMNATQNIKQLGDPNSAVSKARDAYVAAKAATKPAEKREAKASTDYPMALAKYQKAAAELLDGIQEKALRATLNSDIKAAFASHDVDIFLATGHNFADALSAGPAAAADNGVILLSDGMKLTPQVAAVVNATKRDVFGVGGDAAKAFKNALALYGADRYETSVKVALRFFNKMGKGTYALASGQTGADAVTAGVFMTAYAADPSNMARGILLTPKNNLMPSVADYIQYGNHAEMQYPVSSFIVFGGNGVVSPAVVAKAEALSHN